MMLLVLAVVGVVAVYNRLVRLRVQCDNAWADIDVQLKRRHDLIPNVVQTVKGYASHERETLEEVVSARNRAMEAEGPAAQAEAEGMLTNALKSLFALSEDYPELKAAENFRQLQSTLSEIESALQNARRYYNAVVRDFNTKVQQFPSNLVAGAFGFETREFFALTEESERAVPEVEF
jgi:LemA protein